MQKPLCYLHWQTDHALSNTETWFVVDMCAFSEFVVRDFIYTDRQFVLSIISMLCLLSIDGEFNFKWHGFN